MERQLAPILARVFDPLFVILWMVMAFLLTRSWRTLPRWRKLASVAVLLIGIAAAALWEDGGVYGLLISSVLLIWAPAWLTGRVARNTTQVPVTTLEARPTAAWALPGLAAPWVTWGLIAVNVAIFGYIALLERDINPDLRSLVNFGALLREPLSQDMAWRLLAFNFLHGSLPHIAFNMLALNSLGPALERALGRVGFLLCYLLVGVLAGIVVLYVPNFNLTSLLLTRRAFSVATVTVGASACVMGLVGLRLALATLRRVHQNVPYVPGDHPRAFTNIIVSQTVMDLFVPGISITGHLGGVFFGMLVGGLIVLVTAVTRRRS
jgi:membrane associated rhomboid family serine protease